MTALEALVQSFGDLISSDAHDLATYGRDWTRAYQPAPLAIARPRSTAEVAQIVARCRELGVAIVPSGGRTGLAGGAVAARGELVLSLERMRRIGEVDTLGMTIHVEAGAVNEAVQQVLAPHRLMWPIDLASKGSAHIGGNLATNAGGVRVIRYGHARNWVLGLVVVTPAGDILELGGAVEKDNTGLDLRQLYLGSEGTLGIITEATLKLERLPERLDVALFAVDSVDSGLRLFERARQAGLALAAYELFTESCMRRFRAHRGFGPPFASPAACYVLVEVESADGGAAFVEWATAEQGAPGIVDGVIAQSTQHARQLWQLREGISEALGATGLPHKNDIALPIRALAAFCRELDGVFATDWPGWEICLFGHVGDGNIHINVMKPDAMDPAAFFAKASAADHAVFALVERHGGSISAEHGIGLVKKPYLHYSRSPAEISLMKTVKRALDPEGLMNPGKIFD